MSADYWMRIAKTVAKFAQPGDTLECIGVCRVENPSSCELCGHYPIHWLHTLQNSRTKQTLLIGSECINNYAEVYRRRYGATISIIYPPKYAKAARFINKKFPGTVSIEPGEKLEKLPDLGWDEMDVPDWTELDLDDLAPEGMGIDEVDWDSFDWDQD